MSETARTRDRFTPICILQIAIAIGILLLYLPVLESLVGQWAQDDNYRHGFLVPIISALIIYRRRDRLRGVYSGDGTLAGAALLVMAAGLLVSGTAANELTAARLSLPTLLVGLSLFIRGYRFTREIAFPLLFLYMMVPLPYIIYYKIAFPMQLFSAKISAAAVHALGVNVIRSGNVLHMPTYSLEVVAACSGLRSLMTMLTLSLVIGAFAGLSVGRRAVLAAFAVPAAVAANALRLIITALGAWFLGPEFADGFLHTFSGLVVFTTGFGLLMLTYLVLKRRQ